MEPRNQATCQSCGRPLKKPSPDGYGPVCFRRLRHKTRTRGNTNVHPINHNQLTSTGQLTLL